jgi:hypothetical protein
MDICKMDTDSETILAECETIQKQFGDHSLIREGLGLGDRDGGSHQVTQDFSHAMQSTLAAQWPRTS